MNFYHSVVSYIFRSKTGKIIHVLSQTCGIEQKISFRVTLLPYILYIRQLSTLQRTSRPINSVLNDTLNIWMSAYVPVQQTTYQFFQASSQLNFANKKWNSLYPTVELWIELSTASNSRLIPEMLYD